MQPVKHSTALALLATTAVLWSLGGVLIKSVHWHPLAIAASRAAIAAVVMAVYRLFIERKPLHFHWSSAQIGGALCYAATVSLYVSANAFTTNANAIVLQYTAPIYIALFGSWFLKERLHRLDIITTIIVLCGVGLFFFDKLSADGVFGIILALLSGLSMGWMVLFLRKQKDGSSLESMLLGNVITVALGLPFIIQNGLPTNLELGYIGILGVVQIGIPYILYSIALRSATALEGVLLTMLEPILSPIWVMLVIHETPGPLSLIGGVIVIFVVCLRGIWGARQSVQS